jgi:hypothetical protein
LRSQQLLETLADRKQDRVAAGVPEPVVDLLEAVEVDAQDPKSRGLPLGLRDKAGQPFAQADAVHKAGQRIGLGGMLGLGLAFDELARLLASPPHEQRDKSRKQQQRYG